MCVGCSVGMCRPAFAERHALSHNHMWCGHIEPPSAYPVFGGTSVGCVVDPLFATCVG